MLQKRGIIKKMGDNLSKSETKCFEKGKKSFNKRAKKSFKKVGKIFKKREIKSLEKGDKFAQKETQSPSKGN